MVDFYVSVRMLDRLDNSKISVACRKLPMDCEVRVGVSSQCASVEVLDNLNSRNSAFIRDVSAKLQACSFSERMESTTSC